MREFVIAAEMGFVSRELRDVRAGGASPAPTIKIASTAIFIIEEWQTTGAGFGLLLLLCGDF